VTQAPAAIFKIPTESPQPAREAARPARKAKTARLAPGRVLANGTGRAATRGDGHVIELDYGITVYPDREGKRPLARALVRGRQATAVRGRHRAEARR
jgi:hypothetical protein